MKNDNTKKKIIPVVIILVLLLAGSLVYLVTRKTGNDIQTSSGPVRGYIESEGTVSDEYDGLFLSKQDGRYLVELELLDKCLDLDVIKTSEGFAIRTTKHQITVIPEGTDYIVNSNRISGDDSYLPPETVNGSVYADTKTIFDVFGYAQEYSVNTDGSLVKLFLTKADGDPYETIRAEKKKAQDIEETKPQIEELAVRESLSLDKPGAEPETLPVPEEKAETSGKSEEKTTASETETAGSNEKPLRIDRPVTVYKMTEEEFDREWKKDRDTLAAVYESAVSSSPDQPSFEQRSDDFIAFNPMSSGIYYDTVSVQHDPVTGEFADIIISHEWSDQAGISDDERSNAYYAGIEEVVRKTLVTTLGQNAGTELFQYIKAHADIKQPAGYVVRKNEHGQLESMWVEEPVGDGIMASEMDFTEWQGRHTDSGLRFSVSHHGNGIEIRIFKD